MLTELLIGGASYLISKGITKKVIENKENEELSNNIDLLEEAYDDEEYDEAIEIADEIIEEYEDEEDTEEIIKYCKFLKAKSYVNKGIDLEDEDDDISIWDEANKEALNTYKTAYSLLCQYGNEYGYDDDTCWQLYYVNLFLDNYHEARNFCINLLSSSDEYISSKVFEQYNWITDAIIKNQDFVKTIDYEQRKYIFIGRNKQQISGTFLIDDSKRLVNWIFTLDQLPPDIEFPLGRPQPGLYMAHPVKTEQYFPMKNAEETLFMEKVREFCWLAQCLGAREVSFHSIKGMSVSEGYGTSMNVEANVGVKGVNVGGSYGNSSRHDGTRSSHQQVERVQHFDPKKKAYCPDDLVWLDSDPAWKDLIKQRLNGNMLDYTYKISSSETCQMSSNEKDEVKANFEFMMVKVNGSYNSEKDTTFSSSKETEWSIHVEFAPLSELTGDSSFSNTNIRLSKNDQEYLNEVKETIEDYDEIGPKERKRLEKTRMRLGISESRAAELEASICQPKLTDEEKEYLDEVREVRKDYDGISQRERKYLEKTRIRLGISIERANELERL